MDHTNANQQIGQRIARTRHQNRLTPDQLAELVEIDTQTLRRFESGQSPISAIELAEVAKALQMPIEFFVHDGGPLLDWFGEWQVMHTFRQLDAASQKRLIRFLTDLSAGVAITNRADD